MAASRVLGLAGVMAAGMLCSSAMAAPGAWEVLPTPGGGALAKAAGPAPVISIAVACVDNKRTFLMKLAPGATAPRMVVGVQAGGARSELQISRIGQTDGWGNLDAPAEFLARLATAPAGSTLSLDGRPLGPLPVGNAGPAIRQAAGDCGAATATTASAPAPAPGGGPDIRGIRPGMTLPEVQAALKAAGLPSVSRPYAGSTWQPQDARLNTYEPYGRKDLTFETSFTARTFNVPNNWAIGDTVAAVFMPPPSQRRVWGVAQTSQYAPGKGPGARSTIEALTRKYGQPSFSFVPAPGVRAGTARLSWYWDARGRTLGPQAEADCRGAVFNAYIGTISSISLMATNIVALKPDSMGPAVKAGCAMGLLVAMNFDVDTQEISMLNLTLADIANAARAQQATAQLAQQRGAAETNAQRKAAEDRKAAF
ncbi:hypothetical protein [Phenylobacterium sp.]|uniref:hypothetical protein n=1 Tax=Phenylobacterium sp. TaxID=1871053 RepID=UPI0025D5984B|nr:hypothetical protein [Phenylobacterium sp.]MBX3485013.1 hypothetical protein [Phenylobacterium sp.]